MCVHVEGTRQRFGHPGPLHPGALMIAMQLVVDLERRTPAVFVGEPTGGSPNQYGDAISVALPRTGLTARVATVSWETAGPGDERTTLEPDVAVPADSRAFFAGRDLALEAALDL